MTQDVGRLQLSEPVIDQGKKYQFLLICSTRSDRLIQPEDLIDVELPSGIDTTAGVVISGRAPIWLYAYLTDKLQFTAWVACYEPPLGAVVVATNSDVVHIGEVIDIHPPHSYHQKQLCPALMIVGPPNSGKSVFSHALFTALSCETPDIYLQRAHWDGEGNYLLDLQPETVNRCDRGSFTDEFFPYHSQVILELRREKSLVIVDVGGVEQPQKLPILEACSHYLIISCHSQAIDAWHEFCGERGNLKPIGVINSVLTPMEIIHQQKPYLEMTAGPWVPGEPAAVPQAFLKRMRKLILLNK
jgi:CRISPR-associated protein Csx3